MFESLVEFRNYNPSKSFSSYSNEFKCEHLLFYFYDPKSEKHNRLKDECFSDRTIADYMNSNFICIAVVDQSREAQELWTKLQPNKDYKEVLVNSFQLLNTTSGAYLGMFGQFNIDTLFPKLIDAKHKLSASTNDVASSASTIIL
jgi:hypothetical protein